MKVQVDVIGEEQARLTLSFLSSSDQASLDEVCRPHCYNRIMVVIILYTAHSSPALGATSGRFFVLLPKRIINLGKRITRTRKR